ncbi:MAG TPA: serine hydrolase [Chitinophagaceae bacterium]|nr:serine hydrolase [Chitinophagaceae bacterium]
MKYGILFLLLICPGLILTSQAQEKTDTLLQHLLLRNRDSILQMVLHRPNIYRCQIIYTQINPDASGQPTFRNYYYHVDPRLYFNPASTVKMPLAFLSLEKLHRLHRPGVNKYTDMLIDSSYAGQTAEHRDTTSPDGRPSIAQYIKRAFLVSDNDAYNRMYEFVGQRTINRELHQKGYQDVRIIREFLPMSMDENRHTNAIRFTDSTGRLIYRQPPAYNRDSFDFSHVILLGKGHWNAQDSLIHSPMDFTRQNNISLEDLQQIEQSVLFPRSVPKYKRFDLSADDYRFLYRYMSQYPAETNYPKYDSATYYNSYVKFFFKGERIPSYIRVFNKVGWSYGFLTDVSLIVDFRHRLAFMLSCVVYVNSDGILNDNKYDYDTVGYPFFRQVGKTIYQYELHRPRKYIPDLGRFKINYEHRGPGDKRPVIKDIAN